MANVRVRWIDSLSAAATGTKVYRNDVEIADIANGIQEYIDAAAPDDATPKYEVQAHDGAGDETTQEVEGENMDYIDTTVAPPVDDGYYLFDGLLNGYIDSSYNMQPLVNQSWVFKGIWGDNTEEINIIGTGSSSTAIQFRINITNSIRFQLSGTGFTEGRYDGWVNDDLEHIWVCTYDSVTNGATIYLDGNVLLASNGVTGFQGHTNVRELRVGARATTSPFVGQAKIIKGYNKELTPAEVTSIQGDIDAVTDGLVVDLNTTKSSTVWTDDLGLNDGSVGVGVTYVS